MVPSKFVWRGEYLMEIEIKLNGDKFRDAGERKI